jgi:hypothetical protein
MFRLKFEPSTCRVQMQSIIVTPRNGFCLPSASLLFIFCCILHTFFLVSLLSLWAQLPALHSSLVATFRRFLLIVPYFFSLSLLFVVLTLICLFCLMLHFDLSQKAEGWGTMLQAGRSRFQDSMRWKKFFILLNPFGHTKPWGFTEPLTEMSTRSREIIFWGVERGRWVGLTTTCRLSRQCGILNISQPYSPPALSCIFLHSIITIIIINI